jgi:hypothetical protein
LTRHLLGRQQPRPWDPDAADDGSSPPPLGPEALSDAERRTLLEWIDLGAPAVMPSHAATAGGAE